jgi:hypothetical protein
MKTLCIKAVAPVGVCLLGIIPLRAARADPSLADRSMATQLFKEGRALLEQGHVPQACRKLEESLRLEPGGGTLLNLALCHEREGRTATAWVEFTEALGIAKRDDRPQRIDFARAHIAQLEPALSRLFIQVPGVADLPDLEIKRDGSIVGRAAWGSPIPVDPGDHVVEALAPGKIPWRESVVIGSKADSKTLVVPALENAPGQEASGGPSATPGPAPAVTSAPAGPPALDFGKVPPEEAPETLRVGANVPAWIALGLGVAAAGTGTYFALRALSEKSDADRACPNDVCSAEGARQNSDAIKSANFATAGFGVGVVGLGLATVLFATHAGSSHSPPTSGKSAPTGMTLAGGGLSVGPGHVEVMLSGGF